MPHQPTDASDSGGPPVTSHHVEETPEEILEYWTPERMAKAGPAGRTLEAPGPRGGADEDQFPDEADTERD
ncbi:hypothetical protein [Arthrobacter sp.]|uniref:hypothetical protein n=1 Tax=Arthrobacter sp. TaxID=1667 RepID=UPI0028123BFF|nr:hypothetical protein [Arthrobacter sp.]